MTNRVVGWTYDANGNLLSDGQRQYRWDAERRLVGIVHGDGSQSSWVHDGLGKRAWQQEPEGQRRNLWCGEQLCQVTDGANTVMHRYYEEGERVGSQAYLVGRDHLGSVVREFEAGTGALRAEHWYSANGQRQSQCHGAGCPGVSQGWAGQYRHERTGLQLATYRVYDPGSARWLSRDPIGEAGGINLYAYANGNPIIYIDPTGEVGVLGAVIGAGLELGIQAFQNYRNGCDVLDTANYNWYDVGVSAAVGAIAPGWLTAGKTTVTSGRAIGNLTEQLGRAQTANRAAKIEARITKHSISIADVMVPQLGFQGLKEIGSQISGAGGVNGCSCLK